MYSDQLNQFEGKGRQSERQRKKMYVTKNKLTKNEYFVFLIYLFNFETFD